MISFEKLIGLDVEIKLDKQAPENNDENARKLDALMSVMFQFLEYRFKNIESPSDNIFKRMESNEIMEKNTNNIDNTINPNNSEDNKNVKTHNIDKKVSLNGNHNIITSLLKLFREKLLLVYQSKYVQFLHFYMVSFLHNYPQALEEFLSILIASSLSQSNAKLIRLNSISYLSSFLSRATYIPKDLLLKSIGFLLDFLDEFELEEDIGDIGLLQRKSLLKQQKEEIVFIPNEAFVLVLQGILYIFCYQKELLLEKGLACRLEKIMVKTKEFMRLEWVSKEVLDEFLIICENSGGQEGILAVLKDRKDILMDKKQKELFYPFDPYLLKRSEGFIRELYRFWNNERPEEGRKLECEKETDSSSPYIKENEEDKKRKLDEIETGEEKEFEVSLKKKIKK